MNQETILQSNLLDIIFEKRNKDYGAYTLRKFYNKRVTTAVFSMIGFSVIISILLLSVHSPLVLTNGAFTLPTSEKILSVYNPETHSAQIKTEKIVSPPTRKIPEAQMPPRIVSANIIINKPVATQVENIPSLSATGAPQNSSLTGTGINGTNEKTTVLATPKVDKSSPRSVAEIMPQYPGGIPALLAFLKKNIHSPEDIDNGDEVKVEVKFVVNYNGNLESFDVIKSGGAAFDNEVLRVLKKMPLWMPGKSNGENVSVYYSVPVKFTSGF